MEKRLCLGCLNYGHMLSVCNSKRPCGKDGCERFYHQLIHLTPVPNPQKPNVAAVQKSNEPKENESSSVMSNTVAHLNAPVQDDFYFAIVPLTLKGPKKSV